MRRTAFEGSGRGSLTGRIDDHSPAFHRMNFLRLSRPRERASIVCNTHCLYYATFAICACVRRPARLL